MCLPWLGSVAIPLSLRPFCCVGFLRGVVSRCDGWTGLPGLCCPVFILYLIQYLLYVFVSSCNIKSISMNLNSFFKGNLFKVIIFFVLDLVFLAIGSILFIRSLQFWAVPWLRALYIGVSIIWSVGSIWGVAVWFNFSKYWNGLISDHWSEQEGFEKDLYLQYQELMNEYPAGVADFERQCFKQTPRPTAPEMMEKALSFSAEEWAEMERLAAEKSAKRRQERKSK